MVMFLVLLTLFRTRVMAIWFLMLVTFIIFQRETYQRELAAVVACLNYLQGRNQQASSTDKPSGEENLNLANNPSQDQNTGHIANSNHQANHDPAPVPSQPSKPSQTGGVGLVTKPSGQGTEVSKNYQDELQKLYSMPKEKTLC